MMDSTFVAQRVSLLRLAGAALGLLLAFGSVRHGEAVVDAVVGTIGVDSSRELTIIQSAAEGSALGAWTLSLRDTVVPRMIGDFDGDGYDDFVIRNDSAMAIIGTDTRSGTRDSLVSKAVASYGTLLGSNWLLRSTDEVVAVGRFGSPTNRTQMVLKGTEGFAFIRADQGALKATAVVPYNSWIMGGGVGWRVGPGDRIIGVGRLNGGGDCLVVSSGWGISIWVPSGSSGVPTLLSIQPNGTAFTGPNGRTWTLDTTDPSFRFLGAGDVDLASDKRAELILRSSGGLAVLHANGSTVWGAAALDLRFHLRDGEYAPGTPVIATLHWLVRMDDFDRDGRADLLFQTQNGITVLGKSQSAPAWGFTPLADLLYGNWLSAWPFNGDNLLSPLAGDFDGDGQLDIPITSGSAIGLLSVSRGAFRLIDMAPYATLPITDPDRLVGVGKFDRSGRHRLLFKNLPARVMPSRAAVLMYHNDNARTGWNPKETKLTPTAIQDQGLRLKYPPLTLGGVIEDTQEQLSAQVLYAPDLTINGALHDTFFAVTDKNNLYAWDAKTGARLSPYPHRFTDPESPGDRPYSGRVLGIGGIQGTPVIDYASKLMYLVYATMNRPQTSRGEDPLWKVAYWLVAWDLQAAKSLRSVRIAGSYPRSDGTSAKFLDRNHTQRPALLLSKGSLYIAFGGRWGEEDIEYHGWVFRYDASTFEQLGVFNTSPNQAGFGFPARGAGIWQGGGGPVADEGGQVYLMTANGPAEPAKGTYGDFFLKLGPRGYTLQLRRAFTPKASGELTDEFLKKDWDLGAGGPLLIPGTNRILGGGKEGKYSVLNRDTFDRVQADVQAYTNLYDPQWRTHAQWAGGPHLHGNPAYYREPSSGLGYVYHQGETDILKAFAYSFGTGTLDPVPIEATDRRITPEAKHHHGDYHGDYMTNQLSVSSDETRTASGVVWATLPARVDGANGTTDTRVINRLTAYDATPRFVPTGNVMKQMLRCLCSLDITGTGNPRHMPKHTPPTIADGMVIVPNNNNEVRVYELGPPGQSPPPSGCP